MEAQRSLPSPDFPEFVPPERRRSYAEFLASTLNPQRFSDITIDRKQLEVEEKSWFYYNCFRSPNRFTGRIKIGDAITVTAAAVTGGGKSALLGNLAAFYPKSIGVYCSADDEVLADLRARHYRDKVPPKISKVIEGWERGLIVGPSYADVKSSWDYMPSEKLTLHDVERYDVIVFPRRVHLSTKSFFMANEKMLSLDTGVLWQRPAATQNWFVKVLEAANILYARITLRNAKMDKAKAEMIFIIRELRHHGIALGLDFQYLTSLDREVRTNAMYSFVKNIGSDRLPKDVSWMYGWVPMGGFMQLEPNEFVCKDKFGGIYLGTFKLPPWHKTPKENIYKTMGIVVDYGDPNAREIQADSQDEDVAAHMEIVTTYVEQQSWKGTDRALRLAGTPHDRDTIKRHVLRHQAKKCSCYGERTAP